MRSLSEARYLGAGRDVISWQWHTLIHGDSKALGEPRVSVELGETSTHAGSLGLSSALSWTPCTGLRINWQLTELWK